MLQSILTALASMAMKMLASWIAKQISEHAAQVAKDKERGETNDANVAKHDAAITRAEEIKAATDLLNGTRGT